MTATPSAARVQAARAKLALDRKLGRVSARWVADLAAQPLVPSSTEPADTSSGGRADGLAKNPPAAHGSSSEPAQAVRNVADLLAELLSVMEAASESEKIPNLDVAYSSPKPKIIYDESKTTIGELPLAPVGAFEGMTDYRAAVLAEVFNVSTIRDLGTNKYFLWAQAITRLAE